MSPQFLNLQVQGIGLEDLVLTLDKLHYGYKILYETLEFYPDVQLEISKFSPACVILKANDTKVYLLLDSYSVSVEYITEIITDLLEN